MCQRTLKTGGVQGQGEFNRGGAIVSLWGCVFVWECPFWRNSDPQAGIRTRVISLLYRTRFDRSNRILIGHEIHRGFAFRLVGRNANPRQYSLLSAGENSGPQAGIRTRVISLLDQSRFDRSNRILIGHEIHRGFAFRFVGRNANPRQYSSCPRLRIPARKPEFEPALYHCCINLDLTGQIEYW